MLPNLVLQPPKYAENYINFIDFLEFLPQSLFLSLALALTILSIVVSLMLPNLVLQPPKHAENYINLKFTFLILIMTKALIYCFFR